MAHNKYDISLKDLIEDYAQAWAGLAGVEPNCNVVVTNAEISTLEARADKVFRVKSIEKEDWILNLELQASRDKRLPEKIHYKSVALRRKHRLLVRSVVVLLRKKAKAPNLTGSLISQFPEEEPMMYFPIKLCACGSNLLHNYYQAMQDFCPSLR